MVFFAFHAFVSGFENQTISSTNWVWLAFLISIQVEFINTFSAFVESWVVGFALVLFVGSFLTVVRVFVGVEEVSIITRIALEDFALVHVLIQSSTIWNWVRWGTLGKWEVCAVRGSYWSDCEFIVSLISINIHFYWFELGLSWIVTSITLYFEV